MGQQDRAVQTRNVDTVVVGAGFAGMYMLHRLRALGHSTVVLEAGGDVGGTWYWNRYPGARCDAESLLYSYSFDKALQDEWQWTERFATQPEILRYAQHVADRFDLRRDIVFDTRVTAARFDEKAERWTIETDRGDLFSARFCIMASGCLSVGRVPSIPGLEDFRGNWYHTGAWPHESVDFTGKRVAVIGTGSSGIQLIPMVAKQAAQLTVFQRTPNFSVPARNAPLDPDYVEGFKAQYDFYRHLNRRGELLASGDLYVPAVDTEPALGNAFDYTAEEREAVYQRRWERGGAYLVAAFADLLVNEEANKTAADFVRSKIREIVKDPATAEKLCPYDHPIGTKRICVDTDYYATYNRDTVSLVDINADPIERITKNGIRTQSQDHAFDVIIFASGFDAMTGAILAVDFVGVGGQKLSAKWEHGPLTYLGLGVAGFPNLLIVTGPGSPSVFSNMAMSIEQHVDWIAGLIGHMDERGLTRVEAIAEAEKEWVAHVNEVADATLVTKAKSWYLGANVPGKPRVFMPYIAGVGVYRDTCNRIAANDYEGFALSGAGATSYSAAAKGDAAAISPVG